MVGHLEPLTAVLRVGGAYGEPYTWAVTVRYLSPTTVELLGAVRAPTPSEARALATTVRANGIRRVVWQRQDGRTASWGWNARWS